MKYKGQADLLISLVVISILSIFWVNISSAPAQARYYPRFLIGCAFVLAIALLIISIVKIKKKELTGGGNLLHKQVFVLIVLTILYIKGISYLGYNLSTAVFIFIVMWYLGMRQKIVLFLTPILVTLFVHLVFNEFLFVLLPRGTIFG